MQDGSAKGYRVGILHAGSPAAGMNAAARAVTRLWLASGNEVFGIKEGFVGLAEGQ